LKQFRWCKLPLHPQQFASAESFEELPKLIAEEEKAGQTHGWPGKMPDGLRSELGVL